MINENIFLQQQAEIFTASETLPKTERPKTRYSIIIEDKSPEEIYNFWRNLKNLSNFMRNLEINVVSEKASHWEVYLEPGVKAEWDAEITHEIPGSLIAWQSIPNSDIRISGSVRFTRDPQKKNTIVNLTMDYDIPGGKATELATEILGEDPSTLAQFTLRRLKAYLETGEIPTIDGQSSGREELISTIQH